MVRLVRESSNAPTITNRDDTIMTRYAYGGYNGVVKFYGSECGYTDKNGIFKVLDGEIIIDGWEIQIDAVGWTLNLSTVVGTQYHSVYAQISLDVESVELYSVYSSSEYPAINKGDDLTAIPNGTARFLLYNVKVENGTITEVVKKFETIPYLSDIEKRLDELGFKKGVAEVKTAQDIQPITVNSLKKQGKYCIFNFEILTGSDFVLSEVTIPKGFRPKQDTNIMCVGISALTNLSEWTIAGINTEGKITFPNNVISSMVNIQILNAGWEIK
jgi:hypothetical protein